MPFRRLIDRWRYHTVRLSPAVGPEGRIIAQDVTPGHLADLARRVRDLRLGNVTLALGEQHDPRLPPGSLEVALMVRMYHHITQSYAFLYNLAPALKPGARVGIVDLDAKTSEHGTPPGLLRCELAAVGYRENLKCHLNIRLSLRLANDAVLAGPTGRSRAGNSDGGWQCDSRHKTFVALHLVWLPLEESWAPAVGTRSLATPGVENSVIAISSPALCG